MTHDGFTHESAHNQSQEWYTPPSLFRALGVSFDLDPCSPGAEVVPWIPATRHLTTRDNGLAAPWAGSVWMNPPYGTNTPRWMRRFIEHRCGIALVFSRTDVAWFHDLAVRADALCFLRGRLWFVRADAGGRRGSGAGAGSMLVACGDAFVAALERLETAGLGKVWRLIGAVR